MGRLSRRGLRRGAETLEFLATVGVLLVITVGAVMITNVFGNALAAQHALSQTALYVAANGRYTEAIETRCIDMLPGAAGERRCWAENLDTGQPLRAAASAAEADPVMFGERIRIHVSYTQQWFRLCLYGGDCVGNTAMPVNRHVDIQSQTQEVRR